MENIFEINNQVFGLNFREIRVSSKTRRAMRSEFVTPANSIEITYDDICDGNGESSGMPSFIVSGIMYGLLGMGIKSMTNEETDSIVNIVMGCFNGVGGVIALAIDYVSDGKCYGWISF